MDLFALPMVFFVFFVAGSPVICLISFLIGVWALRTHLAPRFGLSLVVLAPILAVTFTCLLVLEKTRPHGDPDLGGLFVAFLATIAIVPQSIALVVLSIKTIVTIRKRKLENAHQVSVSVP
jgi:dolichyl-phosphate-mannose--protein O-mannosyl transferase